MQRTFLRGWSLPGMGLRLAVLAVVGAVGAFLARADISNVFGALQLPHLLPYSPLTPAPSPTPPMDEGGGRACTFESIAGTPVHFMRGKVTAVGKEELKLEQPSLPGADHEGKFDVAFSQFVPQGAAFMSTLHLRAINCFATCRFRELEGRPKRGAGEAVDAWLDGFLLLSMSWLLPGWEKQECARRCWSEPRCRSAHLYRSQCELFERDYRLTHTAASIGTLLRDIKCPNLLRPPKKQTSYYSRYASGFSLIWLVVLLVVLVMACVTCGLAFHRRRALLSALRRQQNACSHPVSVLRPPPPPYQRNSGLVSLWSSAPISGVAYPPPPVYGWPSEAGPAPLTPNDPPPPYALAVSQGDAKTLPSPQPTQPSTPLPSSPPSPPPSPPPSSVSQS